MMNLDKSDLDKLSALAEERAQEIDDGERHGDTWSAEDYRELASRCDRSDPEPITRAGLGKLLADFAAEVANDLDKERLDFGPGTRRAADKIAESLGIRA